MVKAIERMATAAVVLLMIGAVAWRFDSLWGEIVGLLGLLLAILCVLFVFTVKALDEMDRKERY